MPRSERTAESVEQLTSIAAELRDAWVGHADMAIIPWFRGHADSEWRLAPKFYRRKPTDLVTECEIREEFITHAPALCDITPRNEWEWYFLMQHYGAPTRLLDWTDGALIALYFAVRDNTGDRHAAVWALDPWWLNSRVLRRDEVLPVGDPLLPGRRQEHKWLPRRFQRSAGLPRVTNRRLPGSFRQANRRAAVHVYGSRPRYRRADGFGKTRQRLWPRKDLNSELGDEVHQEIAGYVRYRRDNGVSESRVFE